MDTTEGTLNRCLTPAGLAFIKSWESFSATPYQDTGGVWTNGYGNTQGVGPDTPPLTEEEAEKLLAEDCETAEDAVGRLVTVPLTNEQFDALVSFTYNVGEDALRISTLRQFLNAGMYNEVPRQLLRWVFDNGVKIPGLVNRRNAECRIWLEGKYEKV